MKRIFVKNAVVLSVALALASLGIYNIVLKATWTMMSDGVFWTDATQGVVADIVSARHPGALAGIRPGDVLLAIGGEEVLNAAQVDARIRAAHQGPLTYSLLRAEARQSIDVVVQPLSQGRVSLFYYLSLVGFFSLLVGTIVMLRRPPDRVALHFYAICLLFFLMYSLSYTGKANLADWTLFWGDHLAILLLPVVFLHFCLSFPERRLPTSRGWVIPASYLPALGLAGAAVASQVFLRASPGGGHVLIKLSETIDSWQPFYFGALFAVSFAILLDSYGKTKSLTARKQMKWLVWGTGAGVLPFFLFYAVPFALGREPDLPMELAGYIPVGLIPLSLAYAVVKHRLMDVELLFRRTLGYTLAIAVIIGICLVAVNVVQLTGDDEPHVTAIAVLCALLVAVLFSPVKSRVQEGIDRLFFRERYSFRKALLRLSQDLNADLDLARMAERLLEGVGTALGVKPLAVFLPDGRGSYAVFRSLGFEAGSEQLRLPAQGALLSRLAAGEPVNAETSFDPIPEAGPLNLSHYFPCRAKGEVIAIIGVGR
ncbi:MAG: PDZ domain-containing protein, partial [Vicinamibacteria bacterium]